MIINPNPIVASTFNGYWITNAQFIQNAGVMKMLQANLLPYDGTHLLATGQKRVNELDLATKMESDANLSAVITSIKAEIARLSGHSEDFHIMQINAGDPSKPVTATIMWDKPETGEAIPMYRIADCFALCASDTQFAGVFQNTMGEIARLGGLNVEN